MTQEHALVKKYKLPSVTQQDTGSYEIKNPDNLELSVNHTVGMFVQQNSIKYTNYTTPGN